MKVLVTGGSGFIGAHTINALAKAGHTIFNYDLRQGFDILDYETLRAKAHGMDAVVHLAAKVKVQECEQNPQETFRTNSTGTENVLRAAAENSVKKILFASSAAVYGRNQNMPLSEDAQAMPIGVYGESKAAAEKTALAFSQKYGQQINCFRIFNVYGPNQDASSPYSAVIPLFISRAMRGEDLIIYGDGTQTRDFIFVKDVAQAFLAALETDFGENIVNLASGASVSILGLARKIVALADSKSQVSFEKARPGDIIHSHADASKTKKLIGTAHSIEEGLKETIAWFRHAHFHSN